MKLEELLQYDDIVIQCHDDPDADALASGFGLLTYLAAQGKIARLIYSGRAEIGRKNLLLMIEKLRIPVQYVRELEAPELLITVDCQYGEGNVRRFPAKTVAVIDHHRVSAPERLPLLHEVRSGYGSCSTLVWQMLEQAGYDISAHQELSTALYYGLYMDTNKLQEIPHPMDRDMLDNLRVMKSMLILFQNSNLSLAELKIAGNALAGYDYEPKYRFAVVEAEPCDPNILGVISDMLIDVDAIDVCVAYCMLGGGAKLSVRSCVKESRADELAGFLAQGLGSGGGHLMKAGGYLNGDQLRKACGAAYKDADESKLSPGVHKLLRNRLENYFQEAQVLNALEHREDLSQMTLWRKKPEQIGCACAEDIFPVGMEITVRMLEGDFSLRVDSGLYLMVGVEYEVYPIRKEKLLKNYSFTDEPYTFTGEYAPTVQSAASGEKKSLLPYVKSCRSRDTALAYARQLDHRVKLFTPWDQEKYMLGVSGDWLVARHDDPADIYIVKQHIFAKTYEIQNNE